MSILEKILTQKEKEVAQLVNQTFDQSVHKKGITFKEKVKASPNITVISEIKRSSPSKGAIDMKVDPVTQAKKYEAFGAGAISVLTDQTFFNGSMEDLKAVRKAVDLPILCKDFIIDTIQIDQAKAAGANIILLIAAALSDTELKGLYEYARNRDLEVLCEVHNEEEMLRVLELNPDIIGINNRNLKTFDVNLETTKRLAAMVKNKETILISESGIKTQGDVLQVSEAGADAILVGETLMQSTDLAKTFQDLQIPVYTKGVN
ncbi:indole-3-glycerol-phosphate synthase [Virgibacillus profundi]|uniref:Indole-3-glycerol phosphate synthase n=1 Tax=Virgibacillus profundi TaxID=2024555 RepID=A0A2A2IHF4_9BACI|nr:indole-3-glycerol phosphate synthase TrpC [Virgibacillus profundi]PAV30545.1 indole-3-glycerol-phosphate synthase [Virgibacillus profundi]PXY54717.1 indole-3-glycerol phosphate synthase TrpC [Virgibacillus profundi]